MPTEVDTAKMDCGLCRMTVVSIGEILWDVINDEEHLAGAPFNFAVHAARLGHKVLFVSAVGEDERGRRAVQQARKLGLLTRFIRTVSDFPTGIVTVRLDTGGQPRYEIQRPSAYEFPELSEDDLESIQRQQPDWIYFGTLHQMSETAKGLTARLIHTNPSARLFYDVNLRSGSYTTELVEELAHAANVVKLNEEEAIEIAGSLDLPDRSTEEFCSVGSRRFRWDCVCVTRGSEGCSILLADKYLEERGVEIDVADTVGAGDAFAAALLHGLGAGWSVQYTARFANRVGALVASRTGPTPAWTLQEVQA